MRTWLLILICVVSLGLNGYGQQATTRGDLDAAAFWWSLEGDARKAYVVGALHGMLAMLVFHSGLLDSSAYQAKTAADAATLRQANKWLADFVFMKAGRLAMPPAELAERIDLFYVDPVNRSEKLEMAIFRSLLEAGMATLNTQ